VPCDLSGVALAKSEALERSGELVEGPVLSAVEGIEDLWNPLVEAGNLHYNHGVIREIKW